ncbi:MAG TPA: TAXI family TRAP transporter solute-binding subunit [Candidatus Methylomirabilis sp.]|nr:TAXI family TRAP transporter solute-binding subunit [Candidatus Methylomirabilis sp.]
MKWRKDRDLSWVSKESLRVYGPMLVLTLVGFVVAFQFVKPAPPTHLVIATGRTDGAYYQFALRYRELLARRGISLEVRATSGSVENIQLLEDPSKGVDVVFVQGGTGGTARSGELVSLASLYFEPLWVFTRASLGAEDMNGLRGRRLAVGPEGSGTRAIAELLLDANGIAADPTLLLPLAGLEAAQALQAGSVDAAFFVASPQSAILREAIRLQGVALMSFQRADAYTRLYPFLTKLVLPRGTLNLQADLPPRDMLLLAPAASLVVRNDFHPALVDLLLGAATEVHGGAGMFERALQFPSAEYLEFPLSSEARRYFRSGPSFLARYLPFWAATLVDRMKVMLLPLITLLIPLFKVVPPTYRWRVRAKIYRWYRDLHAVDTALAERPKGRDLSDLLQELDRIEAEVRRIVIPLSYSESHYNLRLHIEWLRSEVRAAQSTIHDGA